MVWQLESRRCGDSTKVGDVRLSLMPLRIAASVSVPVWLPSACQTLLPKSRLPWQGPGAPRWEECLSNQEQTAKRLRREAGAFPPSPLASPNPHQRQTTRTWASWEWGMSLSHTMAGTSLCEGAKNTSSGETCTRFFFFFPCLCLSGISWLICFYFFPPLTLLATLPESCHR